MGTETEHVFVTEFPSKAVSQVGKAILTKEFSLALAFPIVKVVEFGLSLVANEGLSATADEPELNELTVGYLLTDLGEVYPEGGFGAGLEDVKALPWKSILKIILAILGGLLIEPTPSPDDTADHPPV